MPRNDWLLELIPRKFSQASVARTLGIDPSLISHWVAGRQLPAPRHLQALLELIEATPEQRSEAWRQLALADAARVSVPAVAA